jgi:aryl-alcohol dehydrogenase-like predicted oxidoreductase
VGGGLLAGNQGNVVRRLEDEVRRDQNRLGDQVKAYEQFCQQLGEEPANVALAWLIHNPVVTAPIIGPRTLQQLDGSLRSLEIHLSESELKALDQIWPGPGGEAPEAYAW